MWPVCRHRQAIANINSYNSSTGLSPWQFSSNALNIFFKEFIFELK